MRIRRSIGTLLLGAALTLAAIPALAADAGGRIQELGRDFQPARDYAAAEAPTPELGRTLELLLVDVVAAENDPDALIGATNRVLRALTSIDIAGSEVFVTTFTGLYEDALAPRLLAADIEHEFEVSPAHKCNKKLNCSWSTSICIKFTWTGPDGSGGVNCYTYSPL